MRAFSSQFSIKIVGEVEQPGRRGPVYEGHPVFLQYIFMIQDVKQQMRLLKRFPIAFSNGFSLSEYLVFILGYAHYWREVFDHHTNA